MRHNIHRFLIGLVAALAMALAGCSAGTSADTLTPVPADGDGSASSTAAKVSPLEGLSREDAIRELFFSDNRHPLEAPDVLAEQQRLIGRCMREQGFDYVDYVVEPLLYEPLLDGIYELGTETEEAQRVGYGYFEDFEEKRRDERLRSVVSRDPNDKIRAALSPEARLEYDIAFSGYPRPPSLEELGDIPAGVEVDEQGIPVDWADDIAIDDTGGCRGRAEQEMNVPVLTREELNLFQDIDARVQGDPELADAEAAWTACMATQGYPLGAVDGIISEIDALLWRLVETATIVEEEITIASETVTIAIERFDQDTLRDIQAEERQLATADSQCRSDTDLENIYRRVREMVTEEVLENAFQSN